MAFIIVVTSLMMLPTIMAADCSRYSLTTDIKNCKGTQNNVIQVEKIDATLDKKCKLSISFCVSTKGFSKANVSIEFDKGIFLHVPANLGDLCTNKDFSDALSCPVKKGKLCPSKAIDIDISELASDLSLIKGKFSLNIKIDHGNGKKTCIDGKVDLAKHLF